MSVPVTGEDESMTTKTTDDHLYRRTMVGESVNVIRRAIKRLVFSSLLLPPI